MSLNFVSDLDSDFALELDTLYQLCLSVNTPRAITVVMMIQNEMFSDLLSLEVKPEHYESNSLSVQKFKDDVLVTRFLSKSPNIPLGVDKRAEAVNTFFKGERQCEAAASVLRTLDPTSKSYDTLLEIKRIISGILGPLNKRAMRSIERCFKFGPGSTTRISNTFIGSDKYDGSPHLTADLYPYYKSILGNTWHENADTPEIVRGNRFTTVPKNAKTDRGICVEPCLNSYVQTGIGTYIRSRLASTGINLNDQTINQEMSRRAYDSRLATIDLSSASDNISAYLVFLLLKDDWFFLLDLCRSKFTLLDGEYHQLSKFSSMGNGYTFELESLIFTAIARKVVPAHRWNDVSIYGDDIIVPQEYASEVVKTLELCGFVVNSDKSCLAGSFFESCGTDYFFSVPVRPFFARGAKDGIPYSLQLANALRRYSLKKEVGCDRAFREAWKLLVKATPVVWRQCHIPDELGDVGLFTDMPVGLKEHEYWEGWYVNTISLPPCKKTSLTVGYLLNALSKIGVPELQVTKNKLPQRGLHGKPRILPVFIHGWDRKLKWTNLRKIKSQT